MMRLIFLTFAPLCLAETIAITGATLVDGTGAAPRKATVVVTDGRIASVTGPGAVETPPNARVIDAAGEDWDQSWGHTRKG